MIIRSQPTTALRLAAAIFLFALVSGQKPAVARDSDSGGSDDVRIGVLGLFHPQQFEVKPVDGQALVLQTDTGQTILEKSSAPASAIVRISDGGIVVSGLSRGMRASSVTMTGRNGAAADFILAIPGKICRHYRGTLEIRPVAGTLEAIVVLDRESAVASIVAAESDPDGPLEALEAQAIATRSYLVAGRGRHLDFDFCDTTHCQFLREAPAAGSSVAKAVTATRGMVLAYNAQLFAAMYTRSCAGKTRTPAQVGLPAATYPYFSVECAYCRRHPQRWTTRISTEDVSSLHSLNEASRLQVDRHLGWGTVPSNDFVLRNEGTESVLSGAGNGHGIGLCQTGAKAMAEDDANFRQILNHYYPNTTVMIWNRPSGIARRN